MGLRAGSVKVKIADQELVMGGDIVLAVGGITLDGDPKTADRTEQYLQDVAVGSPIEVKVLRGGEVVRLSVVRPR
jgi:serine protease Do